MIKIVSNIKQRWTDYQPNKNSLYKSIAFTSILTIVLGFYVGGWNTQGTTQALVHDARVEMAAEACAQRFLAGDNAAERLADLKSRPGRYQRGRLLETSGWGWAGTREDVSSSFPKDVTLACAELLNNAELPERTVQS